MVLWVTPVTDIDSDGRPDRLLIGFQLFVQRPEPASVISTGSVEIQLTSTRDPDRPGAAGRTIKSWSIPPERVAHSVQTNGSMARYLITLILPNRDSVPELPRESLLRVRFIPSDGSPTLERFLGVSLRPG